MSQDGIKLCTLRELPEELQAEANRVALEENRDRMEDVGNIPSTLEMAVVTDRRWRPGRVLKVFFMDGNPLVQAKVERYAHQWERYANIRFEFVQDRNAEIRISFKEKGSWSYLGTECLVVSKDQPTMNYGWLYPQTPESEYSRVVLHEFGHALGCPHEHQSPASNIPWDREAVYRYYMGPPNRWTKEQVDRNIFLRYSRSTTNSTQFDPKSIMVYAIPNSLTIGDFEVAANSTFSETDKQFIQRMYPRGVRTDRPLVFAGVTDRAAYPEHHGEDSR